MSKNWRTQTKISNLRPGDYFIFPANPNDKFVGHAVIAAGPPVAMSDGSYALSVFDSTGVPLMDRLTVATSTSARPNKQAGKRIRSRERDDANHGRRVGHHDWRQVVDRRRWPFDAQHSGRRGPCPSLVIPTAVTCPDMPQQSAMSPGTMLTNFGARTITVRIPRPSRDVTTLGSASATRVARPRRFVATLEAGAHLPAT